MHRGGKRKVQTEQAKKTPESHKVGPHRSNHEGARVDLAGDTRGLTGRLAGAQRVQRAQTGTTGGRRTKLGSNEGKRTSRSESRAYGPEDAVPTGPKTNRANPRGEPKDEPGDETT